MASNIVLKESEQKANKGQFSQTVSKQELVRKTETSQTQLAATDTTTAKSGITLDLEFTLYFRNQTPVIPEGEVEPNPSC